MKKKKAINAKKIIKTVPTPTPEPLSPRSDAKYDANMDNIIFEATFAPGADNDKEGKYVPHHLREVSHYIITSVGPLVSNTQLKKKVKIVPASIGKVTVLQIDEVGYVGTIKPHDIIATIK